jgi:hypothetical protein
MPAARNAWSASRSAAWRTRALPPVLPREDDQERRSAEAAGRSAARRIAAKGRSADADAARWEAAAKRAASRVEEGGPEERGWLTA